MDITTVLTSVGIMGIISFLGFMIALKNKVTDDSKQLLIAMIMNVAVPSIILNGIFNTNIALHRFSATRIFETGEKHTYTIRELFNSHEAVHYSNDYGDDS